MDKVTWKASKPVRVYELGKVLSIPSPMVLISLYNYGIEGKRSASSSVSLPQAIRFLNWMRERGY